MSVRKTVAVIRKLPKSDVTNAEFVKAIFAGLQRDEGVWLCSFAGRPATGADWSGRVYAVEDVPNLPSGDNNYFSIASFKLDSAHRSKKNARCVHCLILDDVGTKVCRDPGEILEPSWKIETSPGNFQIGYALREACDDHRKFDRAIAALAAGEWTDPGMTGVNRYARLPVGSHGGHEGWRTQLADWHPERRYTLDEITGAFGIELSKKGRPKRAAVVAGVDPYWLELQRRGLLKGNVSREGWHDMTCPWVSEHTDGADNGTAYKPGGHFRCHHGHCEHRLFADLRAWLRSEGGDLEALDAKIPGEMGALLRGVDSLIYVARVVAFIRRATGVTIAKEALDDLHRHEIDGFSVQLTARDDLTKVDRLTYRPGAGLFLDEEGESAVNVWRAGSVQPAVRIRLVAAAMWVEHLKWLFPDARDRAIVFDFLVHLVKQRGVKINYMLVLLSKVQGAGRDTLLKPICEILGRANVRHVEGSDLVGSFNPFVKSELIYCTELDTTETSRRTVYNHLKSLSVTPPDYVMVNEKFIPQYALPKVANILISTNSANALMIPETDRRVVVVETLRTTAEIKARVREGAFDRLHEAYRERGWLENFYAWLLTQSPSAEFNAKGMAPDTDAKNRMRIAAESNLHRALRESLEDRAGPFARDLMTLDEILSFLAMKKRIDHPYGNTVTNELVSLGAASLEKRIRIDGKLIRLWAVRNVALYSAMSEQALRERFRR